MRGFERSDDSDRIPLERLYLGFEPVCLLAQSRLVEDLRSGEIDPIVPVTADGDRFKVLANEGVYLAALEAGFPDLRCALVENEQEYLRSLIAGQILPNEHPYDLARRIVYYGKWFKISQSDLGRHFGVKQPAISKYHRIYRRLYPETVALMVQAIRASDRNRNPDPQRIRARFGSHNIGFRHLYELTGVHHRNKELEICEEEAKSLQLRLMDHLTTKRMGVHNLRKKISQELRGFRRPKASVYPISTDVTVYPTDSRYLLNVVKPESIHLVLSSPPYHRHLEHDPERIDIEGYLDNVIPPLQAAAVALVPGGRMVVNIIDYRLRAFDQLPVRDVLVYALVEMGMIWNSHGTWEKPFLQTQNPKNEHKQHTQYQLMPNSEYLLVFQKRGKREIPADLAYKGFQSIRNDETENEWHKFRSVLPFRPSRPSKDNGPVGICDFSPDLVEFLVRMFSCEGDTILDPFIGSGRALIEMAAKHQRSVIGFEKNPEQVKALGPIVSNKRITISEPDLPCQWRRLVPVINDILLANKDCLSEAPIPVEVPEFS